MKMNPKTFLICWLPAFIVVFALNGLFHGQLARDFFDVYLSHLSPAIHKMEDTNPFWVGLLDLILTFAMTYFITMRQTGVIRFPGAAFTGALVNLVSAGAWNFANAAMFSWPVIVSVADIGWHISLGAMGGIAIAALYNFRIQSTAMQHSNT